MAYWSVAVLALAPGGVDAQQVSRPAQDAATPDASGGVAPLVDANGLLYDAMPPAAPAVRRSRSMAAGAPRVVARDGNATVVTTSTGAPMTEPRRAAVDGVVVTTTTTDLVEEQPRRAAASRNRRPRR